MEINKAHLQQNFKLALPVMVTQLGHPLVGFSASVILGHFAGTSALASLALANGYFNLLLIIGVGLSYGITPLVSHALGKGQGSYCSTLLANSLLVNSIAGVLLIALSLIGCFAILPNIGQQANLISQASPLLMLLGLSLFPLMIFLTFKQFAEGIGLTREAMQINLAGNAINIVVGIVLVSGKFGLHSLGVVGIGIAALTDRILMMVAMGYFVFKNLKTKALIKSFTFQSIDMRVVKELLKTGIPITLQNIFEISAFSAAVFMTGWLGEGPLAAYQAAMIMVAMIYYAAGGLGTSATVNTAYFNGKADYKSIRFTAIANYQLVMMFHLITGIFIFLFRGTIAHFFSTNEAVIVMIEWLLCFASALEVFDGLQIVGLGILRGLKDFKFPTLISCTAYWIFALPLSYLLGIHTSMGVYGIWTGLYTGLILASAALFLRFRFLTQQKHKRI